MKTGKAPRIPKEPPAVSKCFIDPAYKGEPLIMHKKALGALEGKANGSRLVKFPDVFHTLSWIFHLNKKECWLLLRELEKIGQITIVPFHGVRLNEKEGEYKSVRKVYIKRRIPSGMRYGLSELCSRPRRT